jgi:hypothetical protein
MGSIRTGVGTEWIASGQTWLVIRQPGRDTVIARDEKSGVESEFRISAVLSQFAKGLLEFSSTDDRLLEQSAPQVDLRDLSDEQRRVEKS